MARYAIRSSFLGWFDAYHLHLALQRQRPSIAGGLVRGYPQHTNQVITCSERHWREALESGTAEVLGHSLHCDSGVYPKKADRPVNLGPDPFPALRSTHRLGAATFRSLNFCRELLQRMSEHMAVPAVLALSVPSKQASRLRNISASPNTLPPLTSLSLPFTGA
jgi:hypothetical protein